MIIFRALVTIVSLHTAAVGRGSATTQKEIFFELQFHE